MLIGRLNDNGVFVRHLFTRVPLSLGTDSYGCECVIAPPTQKRLATALQGLQKIAEAMQATQCHAIATAAIRDCRNRRQLINIIHRRTGIKITVLSGNEEAALIGTFVARQFPQAATVLNADSGGGSTDCAIIKHGQLIANATFSIGTARLRSGTRAEKNRMHKWLAAHCNGKTTAVASGGGARKLAALCGSLSGGKLARFLAQAESMTVAERSTRFDLTPDRARNIVLAAHICRDILQASGSRRLHTINGGLGEAVLTARLAGRQ